MQHGKLHHRRADVWFGFGVIAGLAVVAWLVITLQQLAADLHDANAARDALARQVQQLGGLPIAGPPGSRTKPGPSVTGPRGPRGEQGRPGLSGAPGRAGKDGAAGRDGDAGADGADGQTGPAGPRGEQGPAGATGPQGRPGPTGATGPQGKQGPEGVGDTGPEGPRGPAGPSCPVGYSLQPLPGDVDSLVCRRSGAPPGAARDNPATSTIAPGILGAHG